jgi:hypothetical protein
VLRRQVLPNWMHNEGWGVLLQHVFLDYMSSLEFQIELIGFSGDQLSRYDWDRETHPAWNGQTITHAHLDAATYAWANRHGGRVFYSNHMTALGARTWIPQVTWQSGGAKVHAVPAFWQNNISPQAGWGRCGDWEDDPEPPEWRGRAVPSHGWPWQTPNVLTNCWYPEDPPVWAQACAANLWYCQSMTIDRVAIRLSNVADDPVLFSALLPEPLVVRPSQQLWMAYSGRFWDRQRIAEEFVLNFAKQALKQQADIGSWKAILVKNRRLTVESTYGDLQEIDAESCPGYAARSLSSWSVETDEPRWYAQHALTPWVNTHGSLPWQEEVTHICVVAHDATAGDLLCWFVPLASPVILAAGDSIGAEDGLQFRFQCFDTEGAAAA